MRCGTNRMVVCRVDVTSDSRLCQALYHGFMRCFERILSLMTSPACLGGLRTHCALKHKFVLWGASAKGYWWYRVLHVLFTEYSQDSQLFARYSQAIHNVFATCPQIRTDSQTIHANSQTIHRVSHQFTTVNTRYHQHHSPP
jgi:hypothetical protein